MKNLFLVLDDKDNVATALSILKADQTVTVTSAGLTHEIRLVNDIPMGHKFALCAIETGTPVKKYGASIGISTQAIQVGEHVHLHNIESQRGRGDK